MASIHAQSNGLIKGSSTVRYRQRYMYSGKQKIKIPLPRLLSRVFLTYYWQRLPEVKLSLIVNNLVHELDDGHVTNVSPCSKFSLPSHKNSQAFHAFHTVSKQCCAETWPGNKAKMSLHMAKVPPCPSLE